MGRFPGKVLVLLAITLVLANAGCLARCIVQSCQDNPASCHSHSNSDTGHCPQQNQMKTAVTGAVTLDWGSGFIPVELPIEVTQAEHPYSWATASVTPPWTVPAPLALRI
jgi:hypothetical protein